MDEASSERDLMSKARGWIVVGLFPPITEKALARAPRFDG